MAQNAWNAPKRAKGLATAGSIRFSDVSRFPSGMFENFQTTRLALHELVLACAGIVDRLFGRVGMRRGPRHPEDLCG